jgi:NAD-dependent dihydropyrimidine dehydrogenase PreA subunit
MNLVEIWYLYKTKFRAKEKIMPYTIVSDICEGAADCIPVCPVDCIHWPDTELKNAKGFKYPYIDQDTCIDCGACLAACPVEGAILDDAQPELQKI